MHTFKRFAVIAVSCVGVATAAGAQAHSPAQGDLHWFVGVGPAQPMSDLNSRSNLGFNAVGGAEILVTPQFGVRGEANFQTFGGRGAGFGTTTEIGTLVSGVFHPTIKDLNAKWKPYALAGIGFYSGNFSPAGVGSATGFGFGIGGGTEFLIAGYDLFGEIRFISVSQYGGTFGWIPLTVGIRF